MGEKDKYKNCELLEASTKVRQGRSGVESFHRLKALVWSQAGRRRCLHDQLAEPCSNIGHHGKRLGNAEFAYGDNEQTKIAVLENMLQESFPPFLSEHVSVAAASALRTLEKPCFFLATRTTNHSSFPQAIKTMASGSRVLYPPTPKWGLPPQHSSRWDSWRVTKQNQNPCSNKPL